MCEYMGVWVFVCSCVYVCVRVRARARMRACVCDQGFLIGEKHDGEKRVLNCYFMFSSVTTLCLVL